MSNSSVFACEAGGFFRLDTSGRTPAYFAKKTPVIVTRQMIDALKAEALKCGDVRLCAHIGADAVQHDMILVEHCSRYYPPHFHGDYPHSLQILEGRMAVFVFSEDGEMLKATVLEPHQQFLCYIGARQYHLETALSHQVVFRETKPGPFCRDAIQFASWAPPRNSLEGPAYISRLLAGTNIRR